MKTEWEKVTLGEVATISSGSTPSRSNASFWNGTIPWVTTTQIQNNIINLNDVKEFITDDGLKKSSLKIIPKGTLLMAMYGQGKTRGQVGILNFDSTINQACAAIGVSQKVSSLFLYQYFQFKYEDIRALSNSGGQKNLSTEIIKSIEFNLPPFLEQEKIVDTLSVWDSAIEKTEKLISEKEKKLQWIIIHYFENAEKNKNWIESKLSDFLKPGDKNPVENTANYRKITIKLHKNGIEYINSQRRMVDTRPFYIRRAGELIIGKQNYFNGSIALLEKDFDGAICSNAIMSFSIAKSINPDFLLEAISTKKYLREKSVYANGTGQKELSENVFLSFDVKLPSLKVQNEIMEIVNLQKSEISLLKKQLEQYKLQKQGLMQKLLTGEWMVK